MRILTVVGARPQFIKAAPVSREIDTREGITEVLVYTGQHHDHEMSDVFFDELAVRQPAHSLGIHGGSHGEMTGRMLAALEGVIRQEQPDVVVVYGDTNSTIAGALAAAKMNVPVAHVEAGLRSYNRRMPEEVNRVVADHVSSLLLCPTVAAVENLAKEGIVDGVHHVGDVMYDAALGARDRARDSNVLQRIGVVAEEYAVATVHRAENTDSREALERALDYLRDLASEMPIVLPLHPRTKAALEQFTVSTSGLVVCGPLGYLDMAKLLSNASRIYTDSGGVQKEAYFYGVPCVTLRSETEWTETVDAGWNRLWTGEDYRPRRDITQYGDGQASRAVVDRLLELGMH